jgi:putative thioredoxin
VPEAAAQVVFDVAEADFQRRVVDRSRELPVVVDFWADWCGPCKALGPALEQATRARAGKVELAKVDVDENQRLAGSFGIRGIPAVKAFRDGEVASEFTGALPPAQVEAFFNGLVPSEADDLAARGVSEGDEAALRRALELDPGNAQAKRGLARILIGRNEHEPALELLEPAGGDFVSDGLATRARLATQGEEELASAFEAWDAGDHERALESMQLAFESSSDDERRDAVRRLMVAIFTELGTDHPLAREHRRRLAAALS